MFSAFGGRLELENLVLEDVDSVDVVLKEHAEGLHASRSHEDTEIHLYLCTHGERDCRYGDMGEKVVSALKKEVKEGAQRRQGENWGGGPCWWAPVRIKYFFSSFFCFLISRVSLAQICCDCFVFPQCEWQSACYLC